MPLYSAGLLFFLFLLSAEVAQATRVFVHPGGLNNQANLDFIKKKIYEKKQPWFAEFNRLKNSAFLKREPHALLLVNSKNDNESGNMRDDAIASYSLALMWIITDNDVFAERAITILNAWSDFKAFTSGSDQDKLQAGWTGAVFASAAELMRVYQGWSPNQILSFKMMFKRAFYPQLMNPSSWNGNVDLTQIDALISIAVFNDDEAAFELAIARLTKRTPSYFYLQSDGKKAIGIEGDGSDIESFWSNPTQWINGLTQETCRDNGHHAQYALASAIHVAEIAWNQGVDVYSENQLRYTAAMELMAKQFLSNDFFTCANTKASQHYFNTWEIGFNHYYHRVGIKLPFTKQLIIKKIRTKSQRTSWNIVYETLTHSDTAKP
jgi:hypothetical protein